jgi:glycosyltransferase involved in cell wall biosynthesis
MPKSHIELFLASTHFFPTHGGAQLRFLRYIPGLRDRGIFMQVLAGTAKSKKSLVSQDELTNGNYDLLAPEFTDTIPIHRVQLPDRAGWHRSIVFNQAMYRFCSQPGYRPDVVQVVSSLQPRSVFWLKRFRRLGVSLVYAYTLSAQLPSNPFKRAVRRRTLPYLYNHMDCIVVNSPPLRDQMLEFGVTARIEYIPNGVDLGRFRPSVESKERKGIRSALGIPDHQTVITAVSAVHPRKGTDTLLGGWVHLAKRFPDVHLYIIGLRKDLSYPDLGAFRRKLQDLLDQSEASERVHFTGLVRNVEDYLRASDIFVFPSLREGLPNVVLEAMASGLPVVMTPFVGLSAELGVADRDYLLVERDPQALAAALAKLISDPPLRERLAVNARRWAETNMDLERSLDRYASLYYELADPAKRGGRK